MFALPAELSTSAAAINEATLDGLGLPYPDPQWDAAAAGHFWQGATRRARQAADRLRLLGAGCGVAPRRLLSAGLGRLGG